MESPFALLRQIDFHFKRVNDPFENNLLDGDIWVLLPLVSDVFGELHASVQGLGISRAQVLLLQLLQMLNRVRNRFGFPFLYTFSISSPVSKLDEQLCEGEDQWEWMLRIQGAYIWAHRGEHAGDVGMVDVVDSVFALLVHEEEVVGSIQSLNPGPIVEVKKSLRQGIGKDLPVVREESVPVFEYAYA